MPWLMAFVLPLLLSPAPLRAASEAEALDDGVTDIAKDILPAVRDLEGKICVLDFVASSEQKLVRSNFGKLVAEKLSAELVKKRRKKDKYQVVERLQLVRIMDDADLWGNKPELIDQLRDKAGMDYLVSGTYEVLDQEITVTAKVVKAADGSVASSGRTAMKLTPGVEKLLGMKPAAPAAPPVKLSMEAALVYKGSDNKLRLLHEGMTLTSQNPYGLYLRPAQDCHVYVFQADAKGQVTRLFPNADFNTGGNLLRAGEERWVPNDKELFELDENTGTETIYVVASREELPSLAGMATARVAEFESTMKDKSLSLMGVKGTVRSEARRTRPLKGKAEEIFTEQFKASGNFYYTTSFDHQ